MCTSSVCPGPSTSVLYCTIECYSTVRCVCTGRVSFSSVQYSSTPGVAKVLYRQWLLGTAAVNRSSLKYC